MITINVVVVVVVVAAVVIVAVVVVMGCVYSSFDVTAALSGLCGEEPQGVQSHGWQGRGRNDDAEIIKRDEGGGGG